jgi:demethylmenaquinone methyltransferase / 2-methoxy-6-polyprenyl-1,4-benzoquinol methylase
VTGLVRTDGSGAMFDRIARRYDLLNRVISLGIDRRWRKLTIDALKLRPGARVLDLATGTADLGLLAARAGASVVGVDPSPAMMDIGRAKASRAGLADRIGFQVGDAQALPFADATFDAVCMGFGIRNVPDRPAAVREMARVTRPGGRVAILELCEPRGLLGPFARFYVHSVVPRLGALLSGAPEYRYLERSIATFPAPAEFAAIMAANQLQVDQVRPLTFGVCCLYSGTPNRPEGS